MPLSRKEKEELRKIELAVNEFAKEMKDELRKGFYAGKVGWNSPNFRQKIEDKLMNASYRLIRGDNYRAPNVANYAMMLWWQKESRKTIALTKRG